MHTEACASHWIQWMQAWHKHEEVKNKNKHKEVVLCALAASTSQSPSPPSQTYFPEKRDSYFQTGEEKSHLEEAGFKIRYWSFLHQEGFILSLLVFGQWLLKTYKRWTWIYSHRFFFNWIKPKILMFTLSWTRVLRSPFIQNCVHFFNRSGNLQANCLSK